MKNQPDLTFNHEYGDYSYYFASAGWNIIDQVYPGFFRKLNEFYYDNFSIPRPELNELIDSNIRIIEFEEKNE